jgi:4-amino-4-deoxy-L-arabinose transferase-like glycosyltransferase
MRESRAVFLLFTGAVLFRVLHALIFAERFIVGNDLTQNIILGRKFASGNFYGVLDTYWTPLYPVLIGTLTFFIDSLTLPSRIISLVAGSLAVPVTFYLTRQSYGRGAAYIAAALALFFPHLINSSVFEVGTESVYLVLLVSALIVGWKALCGDGVRYFFLTGVLVGLAYLTRPEGFGYLLFFSILIFAGSIWNKRPLALISFKQFSALLLGFFILASPYLYYLKSETGRWTISGKTEANLAAGSFHENDMPSDEPDFYNDTKGKLLAKTFFYNSIQIHKSLSVLLPVFLFLPIGLGLFGRVWKRRRLKREAYLVSFCLLTFAGYAASVIQTRYLFVLLPIVFGWIACGILELEKWFTRSAENLIPEKADLVRRPKTFVVVCLILIYLYALPLNYFVVRPDEPYEEREAGLWLKENSAGRTPVVFSARLLPVFYAEGKHVPPETKDIGEIFRAIGENKVEYIITGDRELVRNRYLEGFAERLQNSPEFELVYQKADKAGKRIWIFKVR